MKESTKDLGRLLYWATIGFVVCVGRGLVDDVLVAAGVKRNVPTGRPVWVKDLP